MGVLDSDSESSSGSSGNGKPNPQEANLKDQRPATPLVMTPFARMKQAEKDKEAQLYLDFCDFAKDWLQPTGCVQKHMVVLYFREHYSNHKYKYTTAADDIDIEEAFERWNQSDNGAKADMNEFGLYVGVRINAEYEAAFKHQEALARRKTQIKLIIAESKRTGVKPPLEVLKEAMQLGVIEVPKATLDSMQALGARNTRRVSIAIPQPAADRRPPSRLGMSMGDLNLKTATSSRDKEKKKSSLHKSMGNLNIKSSSRKSSSSDEEEEKKKKKSSSSKLHKSMGNLEIKSSSRKSSTRDKERDRDKDSEKKKSSSSRLGKSMGDLDYKSSSRKSSSRDKERKSSSKDKDEKEKKSSSSKEKKERKSSSRDKDKESKSSTRDKEKKSSSKDKDKKSSSKDKDKEKEKKSSSRKSSRRTSVS